MYLKNLLFFLAFQNPSTSFSTNDSTFTPSAFFATPDEEGFYSPIRSPDPDPIVISSDDNK